MQRKTGSWRQSVVPLTGVLTGGGLAEQLEFAAPGGSLRERGRARVSGGRQQGSRSGMAGGQSRRWRLPPARRLPKIWCRN